MTSFIFLVASVPGANQMLLRPVVDIALPRQAVFCSCVSDRHGYICYYRQNAHLGDRIARAIYLDNNFNIRAHGNETITAEDPRVFKWGDHLVIFDNFLNDMHLVWEDNRRLRVPLNGKNLSPMPTSESEIAFFDIQEALRHQCALKNNGLRCESPRRLRQKNVPKHCSPRGGTAAMAFGEIIWGIGHCTHPSARGTLSHSIISWALSDGAITYDLHRPPFRASNIIDATSVVNKSGKLYLITAESTHAWFAPWDNQLYSSRVYRLHLHFACCTCNLI